MIGLYIIALSFCTLRFAAVSLYVEKVYEWRRMNTWRKTWGAFRMEAILEVRKARESVGENGVGTSLL